MATAVRSVKTKAIRERAEKEAAVMEAQRKDIAKAWFQRSATQVIPTASIEGADAGDSAAGATGPAAAGEPKGSGNTSSSRGKASVSSPRTGFWRYQPQVKAFYESMNVQIFVALLIILNFLCNIVEKEVDPHGKHGGKHGDTVPGLWRAFEHSFNAIFLLEILINAYGRWLRVFWCDNWNVFDVVVVAIGCVSFFVELDGPLKLFRTLRALRVLKLFKRIKSLNKILKTIVSAVPGVTNAFLVMVITISIYALIGVEFFSLFGSVTPEKLYFVDSNGKLAADVPIEGGDGRTLVKATDNSTRLQVSPQCGYVNSRFGIVNSATARDICYGEEYFGTFTRAWYTLFQVLTGESWSEAVARPVLFGWDDYGPISIYLSSLYFISFVVIAAFILFNVFVAVLLDKVVAPDEEEEEGDGDDDKENLGPPGMPGQEGIALYPWATGADPQAGRSASDKPSPAKMMQDLTQQLGAFMAEQKERKEEQAELRKLLHTALERLERLETAAATPGGQ